MGAHTGRYTHLRREEREAYTHLRREEREAYTHQGVPQGVHYPPGYSRVYNGG